VLRASWRPLDGARRAEPGGPQGRPDVRVRRAWPSRVPNGRRGAARIGRLGLKVADPARREGELSYTLHRAHWGRGSIPEAARALLDVGLAEFGLHRVWADCDPANGASIRVLEKLGLRREAHLREHVWLKGM
jgi:RimJ/RimL family protein N-acetyltransferase